MIATLSATVEGLAAYIDFGIDALSAVPLPDYPPEFREKGWPQKVRFVERKRAASANRTAGKASSK